jgi:GNAT superfamily N-acetyltransferase
MANQAAPDGDTVAFLLDPPLSDDALNTLFAAAWRGHHLRAWAPILGRSLVYVGAFEREELVGFVNVAWDGGVHAFLLDTTVHPAAQRHGIGTRLVQVAAHAAHERGAAWLHVDYEPHLDGFYHACGFRPTLAGLIRLDGGPPA